MAKRLSRRAFIRAAAAAGAVTSVLGCEQNAQSVEQQSSQGAQSASAAIAAPPSWNVHDKSDTDLQAFYDKVNIDVFSWGQGCLRLHKRFSKVTKISALQAGDLGNDATELKFAADLIESMAVNTSYVREHIRKKEPVTEQKPWPDPDSIPGTPDDGLLHGIRRWIEIESQLFAGILSVYSKPINDINDPFDLGPGGDDVAQRNYFHDELYRLAYNVPLFIEAENRNHPWPVPDDIHHVDAPSKPAPGSYSDKNAALVKLEWNFHKLVQAHMEIAGFMPAHLRLAAMTRAGGARVAIK